MTDKPTAPDLAALSAAATQGEWKLHSAMLGYKGDVFSPTAKQVQDCHHIARFYAPKPARKPLSDLELRGAVDTVIAQIEANAAFIVSLVNEYRTGNLVQIDREGMRERAIEALEAVAPCATPAAADAAISAILGETK